MWEEKDIYISNIIIYESCKDYINDHTLSFNVDIDYNNAKQHVDTDKNNISYATIINERYHSSPNTDIWYMGSQ